MTLTELRYIVAVARERHFGRAASRCFVSQPTLSIAIKKFEDELGLTLFERGSDITVTEIGKEIVEQAQVVLEQAEMIKRIAGAHQNPLIGALKLGIIFTIGPYLLPKLIPALRQLAPDMPLILEENYTARLSEMLKRGEIDVAILAEPFEEQGIVTFPVYDEEFLVATPKNHPWKSLAAIPRQALADENILLLNQGNCFRDHVLALCEDMKRPASGVNELWHKGLQGSSLTTIRHMVASGLGVTVLPATSIGPGDEALLELIPFEKPAPTRRVILAARRQYPRMEVIDTLKQAIRQANLEHVTYLPE